MYIRNSISLDLNVTWWQEIDLKTDKIATDQEGFILTINYNFTTKFFSSLALVCIKTISNEFHFGINETHAHNSRT